MRTFQTVRCSERLHEFSWQCPSYFDSGVELLIIISSEENIVMAFGVDVVEL